LGNSNTQCAFIATAPWSDETLALAKALDFESLISSDNNDSSEKTQTEEEQLDESRGQPALDQRLGNQEEEGMLDKGSDKREDGDLQGATPLSDANILLDMVHGDHVHQNPGTHLNGGILDDAKWQHYW
jgi:hypothetical protein